MTFPFKYVKVVCSKILLELLLSYNTVPNSKLPVTKSLLEQKKKKKKKSCFSLLTYPESESHRKVLSLSLKQGKGEKDSYQIRQVVSG